MTPDPLPTSTAPRSAMWIVFVIVFIDLLGFGIVLPLLPRYAATYLGGFPDWLVGVVIGLLYSSFSLAQFIFSPVWGRISDRIGRRPILLLGLVGSVLFYALFAVASVLPASQGVLAILLLLASRVGAGIAGASVSTASAVIADVTKPEDRAKGMGLIGAAFGIGFTFGPLLAFGGLVFLPTVEVANAAGEVRQMIEPQYLWIPGGIASALSGIATLLAYFLLPETRTPGGSSERRSAFDFGRTVDVLRTPAVGPLILCYFLAIFAFANFEGTLSLFTEKVFLFDEKMNFLVFAGVGLVLMIAQGGFYRRFAGKVSEVTLMVMGLVMMFVGLGGLGLVAIAATIVRESPGAVDSFRLIFYISAGVAVFGFAFLNPSVAALVSRRADPSRQGEVLGVNQSFAALGRILGPLLGLILLYVDRSSTSPFLAACALLLLVVFLLPVIRRTAPPMTVE